MEVKESHPPYYALTDGNRVQRLSSCSSLPPQTLRKRLTGVGRRPSGLIDLC